MSKKIDPKILANPEIKSKSFSADISDSMDKFKFIFKKFSKLYNLLVFIFSPVYFNYFLEVKKFIRKNVKRNMVAINLGSGNLDLSDKVSNIDIVNYDSVDLVCDIEKKLPFKDQSVDVVIMIAVLEHVPAPEKIINEIFRVLKRSGKIFCLYPFIQGFHASPYDFSRVTEEGLKVLFKEFKQEKLICSGGPTSGLLWVFQEWIGIVFSFGLRPLQLVINMLMMLLTFPLKFLDILLIYNPMAKNISSGFVYIGRK